ncbi:MAG: hypothetical protein R3E65_12380, partial [Steroidobacteraceae bacterium]
MIIVSGDIAFSGAAPEYAAAESFLLADIRDALLDEGCGYADVIVAPEITIAYFKPDDAARGILVDHIVNEGSVDLSTNLADQCTAVQKHFFDFAAEITKAEAIYSHPLWTEHEFNFLGTTIRISALNAAWMSRIPEKKGELVFPVDDFISCVDADCALRIAVIHHPISWYCESSFHPLRGVLQSRFDLVLSGHVHTDATLQQDLATVGTCTYFEAAALQPHSKSEAAGFSVLRLDRQGCRIVKKPHQILDGSKIMRLPDIEMPIPDGGARLTGTSSLTPTFQNVLRDPGGNFIHPEKAQIFLDDIFVFPEVSDRAAEDERDFSAERLLKLDEHKQRILFIGDEKAGKTTLLLEAFREWHLQGCFPIYVRASELKIRKDRELEHQFSTIARSQYTDAKHFETASLSKRMVLIDDIDDLPGGRTNLHALIEYCDKHFARTFVTATT